jgi:hypothetical protein
VKARGLEAQAVVWALAELSDEPFGFSSSRLSPMRVTDADFQSAANWAARQVDASTAQALSAAAGRVVTEAPRFVDRVIPIARQRARELVNRMRANLNEASVASAEFAALRLPWTGDLEAAIRVGQERPNQSLLAAALVLAGERNEQSVRKPAILWAEARENPNWLRAIASLTALRLGEAAAWPSDLRLDVLPNAHAEDAVRLMARVVWSGGEAFLPTFERIATRHVNPEIARSIRTQLAGFATNASEARPND